ncbi:MAG TPA: hypothetical protein VM840_12515 [Actinomycetota bacterium]|nr:hypothetical protein [Actinomycetota bacterium]
MRLYRFLMLAYPRSFRDRFGEEMLLDLEEARREMGPRIWTRTLTELVTVAPRARWEEGMVKTKLIAGVFLLLIAGGGTMLVTGLGPDIRSAFVPLLILAGLVALMGIAAATSRAGAERTYAVEGRRWWWIPAGLLGLLQVAMGVGQFIDDPSSSNLGALVLFVLFGGLILGGMSVQNRVAGNWMIAAGALPMLPFVWMVGPPVLALVTIVMAVSDNLRAARRAPAI